MGGWVWKEWTDWGYLISTPIFFFCSNLSVVTLPMISYIRISPYISKELNDFLEEMQV